ncbi:MAG: BACON domain-containing protein [Alistipes sp.]|nr:BACON domain-containing protein [Alistipes sp.]
MKLRLYIDRVLYGVVLCLALMLASCQQAEPSYGTSVKICQLVDGQEVEVTEFETSLNGQMYEFLLYSDIGEWQLKPTFEEDNEWCQTWPSEGKNDARFSLKVFENKTAYPRTCEMNVVARGQVMATITFNQTANLPIMEFAYSYPDDVKIVSEAGERFKVRINSNIEWKAVVTQNSGWLTLGEKVDNYQEFVVAPNDTDEERISSVTFRALGTDIEHILYVQQGTSADFDAASKSTIADVLMQLEEGVGTIRDNIYVQGYVISDPASGNFDDMQMVVMDDSQKAICVEFEDIDSNIYPVNSLVTLHLKDMAFVLDTGVGVDEGTNAPKIAGFPSSRVKAVEASAGIAPIEIDSAADLADYEYCLVKLSGVEYAVPYGTYVNVNEDFNGDYLDYAYSASQPYNTFYNEYVHPLRDAHDNLTELYTRRTAKFRAARLIPEGSGSITGVVMRRTKGDKAVYHLRMRSLEDDNISDDATTRRARTIMQIGPWTERKLLDKITASVGTGHLNSSATNEGLILSTSSVSVFASDSWARSVVSTLNETNGKWYPIYATAEGVTYFSVAALNWWGNNYNRIADCDGVAWVITTTTTGVEGQLSLDWTMCSSSGGPMYFMVEYATYEDAPLAEWTQVAEVVAANSTMSYGQKMYTLDLPEGCKNVPNLVIRLRVSQNLRAKNTSAIDASGNNKIGMIRLSSR